MTTDNLQESNHVTIAMATLGAVADNKPLAMASFGIFGSTDPTPSPTPLLKHVGFRGMAVNVGRLMS